MNRYIKIALAAFASLFCLFYAIQNIVNLGPATWFVGTMAGMEGHEAYPNTFGFDFFYGFCNTGVDYFTHERYGVPSMFRGNRPTTEDRGTYCTFLFEREAVRGLDLKLLVFAESIFLPLIGGICV